MTQFSSIQNVMRHLSKDAENARAVVLVGIRKRNQKLGKTHQSPSATASDKVMPRLIMKCSICILSGVPKTRGGRSATLVRFSATPLLADYLNGSGVAKAISMGKKVAE